MSQDNYQARHTAGSHPTLAAWTSWELLPHPIRHHRQAVRRPERRGQRGGRPAKWRHGMAAVSLASGAGARVKPAGAWRGVVGRADRRGRLGSRRLPPHRLVPGGAGYDPGLYPPRPMAAGPHPAGAAELAWPRRLVQFGRLTGAATAVGLLAFPGILRGMIRPAPRRGVRMPVNSAAWDGSSWLLCGGGGWGARSDHQGSAAPAGPRLIGSGGTVPWLPGSSSAMWPALR